MNKDFLGQDIEVGRYVAFTARYSNSVWLQIGKVRHQEAGKVTVRSCHHRWNGPLSVASKDGTLTALDRVVVLSTVPDEIETALEAF